MRLQNILCAVDFSPISREALQAATELANQQQGTLTLIHVFQLPAAALGEIGLGSSEVVAKLADTEDQGLAVLQREAETLIGKPVTTVKVDGVPDQQIVEAARQLDCDVVVLGTHGRTGIAKMLLGSVAEKVVRNAPCPVLVVRSQEAA